CQTKQACMLDTTFEVTWLTMNATKRISIALRQLPIKNNPVDLFVHNSKRPNPTSPIITDTCLY
ncbi:hypothetical protein L6232_26845, partial [Shewanella sp. C31]|nr:hypothetical protein [Shewanella electrica]